ncbi:hypothetical protein Tco_0608351 [Tanacetum coccineum]
MLWRFPLVAIYGAGSSQTSCMLVLTILVVLSVEALNPNNIEWFKRGEALQAKKVKALKSTRAESSNANRSKTPTKSGCSRHMTGVKSYLHKYVEQPGPKVVFGDDSTCTTKGQLCNAKYIVQFDEKRGTIFNSNKEVVMISPRVRVVYVLDMTSSAQES